MSVQFGKLNFEGIPIEEGTLDRIRSLLKPYGPDGEGYVRQDCFQVLYRPFHTTHESRGEVQPYTLPSGSILTWDGRLDNREELGLQLSLTNEERDTDLGIVAAAYDRWQTNCFARIIGDWAMSIYNPRDHSLVLAKDIVGVKHLFYMLEESQVSWCTILEPLVLFGRHPFELSEEYLAGWLSLFPADHLTPYTGVLSVPAASFVRISRRTHHIVQYWNFDRHKQIRYHCERDYEEHFRTVLSASVRRRLRSDTTVLAELSGGLDSSSIVCVADRIAGWHAPQEAKLKTVSYYSMSEPNWDERPYFSQVEAMRGGVGCHIEVNMADAFQVDYDTEIAVTPSSGICLSPARLRFCQLMQSEGSRVLLSGIGGDEFNGGVPSPIPELADLLSELRLARFLHQLNAWALYDRKPWPYLLAAVLEKFFPSASQGFGPELGASRWLNAGFARRNRRALSGYKSRWSIFGTRPSLQEHTDTLSAIRRQFSVDLLASNPPYEKRYPYLDRDFLEFVSAVPPDQLIRPGQRRSLMRRALRGIVPEELLDRKRKAHVVRGPMLAILRNFSLVRDLCDDMISTSLGIVDQNAINATLQDVQRGCSIPLVPFFRTLTIEWWLRSLIPSRIVKIDERLMAGARWQRYPSCQPSPK